MEARAHYGLQMARPRPAAIGDRSATMAIVTSVPKSITPPPFSVSVSAPAFHAPSTMGLACGVQPAPDAVEALGWALMSANRCALRSAPSRRPCRCQTRRTGSIVGPGDPGRHALKGEQPGNGASLTSVMISARQSSPVPSGRAGCRAHISQGRQGRSGHQGLHRTCLRAECGRRSRAGPRPHPGQGSSPGPPSSI